MANKSFGNLQAKISADSSDFKKGLSDAAKDAEGFKSRVSKQFSDVQTSIGDMSGTLTGMFAGLSMAGIVTGFMNVTNSIDRLNDVADATGASIEGISRLENIAIATGESIDIVESALSKLVTKLNDVDDESNVSRALKVIGLDAEELRSMDPAEALNKVAIALSQYENDANKAQLGTALLGKSYKELAPFLNDIAEQQHMVATVTGQMAAEADRLNKIINGQKAIFSAYSRDMAGNVLPVLSDIATAFLNSGDSAQDAGTKFQFLTNLIKYAAVAGNELAYIFDMTGKEIGVVMAQIDAMASGDFKSAIFKGGMGDQWKAQAQALTDAKNKRNAAIMNAGNTPPPTTNTTTSTTDTPPKKKAPDFRIKDTSKKSGGGKSKSEKEKEDKPTDFELGIDYGKAYGDILSDLQKKSQELDISSQDLTDTQKKLSQAFASPEFLRMPDELKRQVVAQAELTLAQEKSALVVKEINDLIAATPTAKLEQQKILLEKISDEWNKGDKGLFGDTTTQEAGKKYGEVVNNVLGDTTTKVDQVQSQFIDLSSAVDDAANKMSQSFIDFASGAQSSFSDMTKSILADIGKMIVRQMIFNALKTGSNAMAGSSTGWIATIGSAMGGKVTPVASANGNVFSAGFGGPNLIPFADGGIFDSPITFPMSGGRNGLMAESGPEAVIPLTRTNGKLGVNASGLGNTNVINQVSVTVNTDKNSNADEIGAKTSEAVIRALAKQEIQNATRYGGLLSGR